MIAVIFEVTPREGRQDDYLAAAAGLRAHLQQLDGFLSIERFASLSQPGKLLSLSFWRDEEAVARWHFPRRPLACGRRCARLWSA